MSNSTENNLRSNLIFCSMLLMLVCLLVGRAALSISMTLFAALCLLHRDILKQLKNFATNYFLIAISLLFFIPFISGLWSEDVSQWKNVVQLKLPFLFFPMAFAGSWKFSQKQWRYISFTFLIIVLAGCVWSLLNYAFNFTTVHAEYLKAKTITTPLENDHVRFSWLVSVAIIFCLMLLQAVNENLQRTLLIALCVFFIIYLHILSARTGLISFYIFVAMYALWKLIKNKNKPSFAILLAVLIILPILSWFAIPTFQNRIKYFLYDYSFLKNNTYLPGSNDGARVLSIKSGWYVLQQHPFGVGAGDIMHETEKWYAANVPGMLPTDKFYPCSEWLMHGCFAGWIGILLFTTAMAIPFFVKDLKYRFFWTAFNVIAAFSFAFDLGLEVQFGIFLYALLLLWWYKWLKQ